MEVELDAVVGSSEGSADEGRSDCREDVVVAPESEDDRSVGPFVVVELGGVDGAPPSFEVNVGAAESLPSCLRCRANPAGEDTPLQNKMAAHVRRRILTQRILVWLFPCLAILVTRPILPFHLVMLVCGSWQGSEVSSLSCSVACEQSREAWNKTTKT